MIAISRWTVARDPSRLALGVVVAIPAGIVVGLAPSAAVVLAAAGLAVTVCLAIPIRLLPAMLLGITVGMPILVFEGVGGSGQARAVLAVFVLAVARLLMARVRIEVPGVLALAVGLSLGITLITALVASTRPARQVGGTGDLVRDLSYPAAAAIGFVSATATRGAGTVGSLVRALAWITLIAALLSVWYWGWHTLGLPPLSASLFSQILGTSGFAESRSIFPFVEDSPNVGAVVLVLLAAFSAPPLLSSPARRDRPLGLAVVVASLAAVLCTQSRTGLFAVGAAAVTYLLLTRPSGGRRLTVALTVLLLIGAGGVAYATFPAERASSDTLQARFHIWSQAERAFLADPILGHGYEYSLKGNFVEGETLVLVSHAQSTHSDLISELVDGGVVGAAIFIAVLGLMVLVARTGLAVPRVRALAIGYSSMLAAFVVGGLDNTLTQSAAAVTIGWLSFGVMVGALATIGDVGRLIREVGRRGHGVTGRWVRHAARPAGICAE